MWRSSWRRRRSEAFAGLIERARPWPGFFVGAACFVFAGYLCCLGDCGVGFRACWRDALFSCKKSAKARAPEAWSKDVPVFRLPVVLTNVGRCGTHSLRSLTQSSLASRHSLRAPAAPRAHNRRASCPWSQAGLAWCTEERFYQSSLVVVPTTWRSSDLLGAFSTYRSRRSPRPWTAARGLFRSRFGVSEIGNKRSIV